jgi:hypothetical protein
MLLGVWGYFVMLLLGPVLDLGSVGGVVFAVALIVTQFWVLIYAYVCYYRSARKYWDGSYVLLALGIVAGCASYALAGSVVFQVVISLIWNLQSASWSL